jgi:putative transposase
LIGKICYLHPLKLSVENEKIADLLLGLTQNQRNW